MKHSLKKTVLPLAALGVCLNAYAAVNDGYSIYYDSPVDNEMESDDAFTNNAGSTGNQETDDVFAQHASGTANEDTDNVFPQKDSNKTSGQHVSSKNHKKRKDAYSNHADSANAQDTEAVTLPANYQGVRGSMSYLLGQPTYNSAFVNNLSTNLQLNRIRPAFTQSGIGAEFAYDFSNGKFVGADVVNFFGNTQSINSTSDDITGKTKSNFLRVGADMGQTIYASDNLLYRLSFGVQYTRIGISEETLDTGISELSRKSVFNGLGPRIGLGAEYDIGWNLSLVGHTYASLNVGNIKTNTVNTGEDELSDSFRTVVPGLEGNLGVRYNYDLEDGNGNLYTEVGYEGRGYFNSFSGTRDGFSNGTINPSINSPSTYGNHAVYFKLGYNGGHLS